MYTGYQAQPVLVKAECACYLSHRYRCIHLPMEVVMLEKYARWNAEHTAAITVRYQEDGNG